ncbi:hypothetical protein Bca4012_020482 [Brassica carinata]
MVQTLLGMVLKVREVTWTTYGHFTRPRSHEEVVTRARSSLERANLILTSSTIYQDETGDPAIYLDSSTIFPASSTSGQGDMGDTMVQTLLGMVPKVRELTWTTYGRFTRPRSHEEVVSRARSSLERANLKDGRYFMIFYPFLYKDPTVGSLRFS